MRVEETPPPSFLPSAGEQEAPILRARGKSKKRRRKDIWKEKTRKDRKREREAEEKKERAKKKRAEKKEKADAANAAAAADAAAAANAAAESESDSDEEDDVEYSVGQRVKVLLHHNSTNTDMYVTSLIAPVGWLLLVGWLVGCTTVVMTVVTFCQNNQRSHRSTFMFLSV